MLALDHRGKFRKLINPENPNAVKKEQMINLKKEIIAAVNSQLSGLLIDPEYGLEAYKRLDLPTVKPFLLSAEKTGYKEEAGERITEIKYSAQALKNLGAAGVKLLIYFKPSAKSAVIQIETAKKVLRDAYAHGLPFFLEIVNYGIKPDMVQSAKILLDNNVHPDVFKFEYPGSPETCQQMTGMLGDTPWILHTTTGSDFEEFCDQLEIASKAGCKGFLVGRSLWQEAVRMTGEEKGSFLKKTLPARFERISKIVQRGSRRRSKKVGKGN